MGENKKGSIPFLLAQEATAETPWRPAKDGTAPSSSREQGPCEVAMVDAWRQCHPLPRERNPELIAFILAPQRESSPAVIV